MKKHLLAFLGTFDDQENEQRHEDNQFLRLINVAKEEWQTAQSYFEQVTDPDLVDYAIYKIEASRRRYMYLLKQAREKGLEDKQFFNQLTGTDMS